jgi:hypothetical protein
MRGLHLIHVVTVRRFRLNALLFLPVFLTMTLGSAVLFIYLPELPFGIQAAGMVCYTSAVVLYTFSANRRLPRYLFGCPVVRAQLPRLVLRHMAFLAVLFVLLTFALQIRPFLPAPWLVASGERRSIHLCAIRPLNFACTRPCPYEQVYTRPRPQ